MKPKPEIKSLGKHEAVHRWGYTRVVVVVVMHLGRTFIKHKQKQRERDLRGGVGGQRDRDCNQRNRNMAKRKSQHNRRNTMVVVKQNKTFNCNSRVAGE